jgi:phenylpyruvate tautomerase PptA (4-oxalocrotonate tautomerase family)
MPLYRFAIREGLSTEEQRARIAREVVRVHCGVTAAPPSFVHAFFQEQPESNLPDGLAAFVLGSIRWGRTDEQKAEIVSELKKSVSTALGCRSSEVGVVTVDIPSKWNREGGALLPEPGEEEEWLERHHF